MQTEFEFTLPKGYLDAEGNVHRRGTMRLATAMDEIVPLQDPRVKNNPAYATVIILSRVIAQLGAVEEVSPRVVESFFACDLSYLQTFYRQINQLDTPSSESNSAASAQSNSDQPASAQPNAQPPEATDPLHPASAEIEERNLEQLRQKSSALL